MRMSVLTPFIVGLGVLAAAPLAAQSSANSDDDGAGEHNPVNTIICRRVAPPTGTRIGSRRICKTQHEWNQIEDEARGITENISNSSRVGNED